MLTYFHRFLYWLSHSPSPYPPTGVVDKRVAEPIPAPTNTLSQWEQINERQTTLDKRIQEKHREYMRMRAEVYGGVPHKYDGSRTDHH